MMENSQISYRSAFDMLGTVNSMMETFGDDTCTAANKRQSV